MKRVYNILALFAVIAVVVSIIGAIWSSYYRQTYIKLGGTSVIIYFFLVFLHISYKGDKPNQK